MSLENQGLVLAMHSTGHTYKLSTGRLKRKAETCINQLLQLGKDQAWNQYFFHKGIRVLMSLSLIKQCSTCPMIYAIHALMH